MSLIACRTDELSFENRWPNLRGVELGRPMGLSEDMHGMSKAEVLEHCFDSGTV